MYSHLDAYAIPFSEFAEGSRRHYAYELRTLRICLRYLITSQAQHLASIWAAKNRLWGMHRHEVPRAVQDWHRFYRPPVMIHSDLIESILWAICIWHTISFV